MSDLLFEHICIYRSLPDNRTVPSSCHNSLPHYLIENRVDFVAVDMP
jgi:hypothetical protein